MTDSPLWGVLFIRSMMKMKETRDQFKKGPLEQSGNSTGTKGIDLKLTSSQQKSQNVL